MRWIETLRNSGMETSRNAGIETSGDTGMETSREAGMETSRNNRMEPSGDTGLETLRNRCPLGTVLRCCLQSGQNYGDVSSKSSFSQWLLTSPLGESVSLTKSLPPAECRHIRDTALFV